MFEKYHVILAGTDPDCRLGGIAFALPGYLAAMDSAQVAHEFIATYHTTARGGKWWWWLRALPVLCRRIVAEKSSGKTVIVYSHPGAGISLLRQGVVSALSRVFGARTIIQLHAPEIDAYLQNPMQRRLFLLAIFPASALAVLTPWWQERLSAAEIGKSVFVIPNPLPASWEDRANRPRKYQARSRMRVLALSRMEPGKGMELLLAAIPLLPESVEVVIAGDGSLKPALEGRVKALGIETRIRFTGWVSGEKKQRLFDEADLFCLPSSYDSFGMGFLEAMANGLPVVALDWGPIKDVVAHGRCGLLIEKRDPALLAEAIQRFAEMELRRRMGHEARQWVLEQFSASRVGKSLKRMFEELARV